MSADLIARLRATSYLRHRGLDYEPLPVPPSALALEAADALEAALSERDAVQAQIAKVTSPEYLAEALEKVGVVDAAWQARVTALEKALNTIHATLIRLAWDENAGLIDVIDAALSPKLGEEKR
jgi:hypothetical protein